MIRRQYWGLIKEIHSKDVSSAYQSAEKIAAPSELHRQPKPNIKPRKVLSKVNQQKRHLSRKKITIKTLNPKGNSTIDDNSASIFDLSKTSK